MDFSYVTATKLMFYAKKDRPYSDIGNLLCRVKNVASLWLANS